MKTLNEGDRAVRKDVGDAGHVYRIYGPRETTGAMLCDFWSDSYGLQHGVNVAVLEAEPVESEGTEFVGDVGVHGDPDIIMATAGSDEPTIEVKHKGGGFYAIYVDGEEVDSVRGKAAAEAWEPE